MEGEVKKKKLILIGAALLILLLIISVTLGVTLSKRKPKGPPEGGWSNYRLSNTTLPLSYSLSIQPFIEENRFEGTVSILLNISAPTDFIYLHQKRLTIHSSSIISSTNNVLNIKNAFSYPYNEYWVVQTQSSLSPGHYTLRLQFSGSFLNGNSQTIVGFYRSTYKDTTTNTTKYMATTKFEPTYARRAFPCFDEPNKKARFQISMITDSKRPVALSNMPPQKRTVMGSGWTKTDFAMSVPMSTYLVCFISSDFVNKTITTSHGVPISTWAPKDRIAQTAYALDVAVKVLDHYDDYFGIPYKQSIPKLDLISVPDFVSGAMENWGIITFRETRMLFAEGINSASRQESVASVVAHELAHMWFGNIVTMNWWDDLWLNEGFATFMSYTQGMATFAPQWKPDSVFVVDELQGVLPLDASLSSHPIIIPVATPDQINSVFDSITYNKGSSVLRMLDDYMNARKPDSFKIGVQTYLKKFMYANARTNDLWDVLQNTSGINVRKIMKTWTKQMGFPLVSWNASSGLLSQTRFYSNPLDKEKGSPLSWDLPVTFRLQNGSLGSRLIPSGTESMRLDLGPQDWIKFNVKEKGYYRVNYDESTWASFTSLLAANASAFEVSDRAQLVDDSFALAAAGIIDYKIPLSLIKYMKGETYLWPPWVSLSTNLDYLFQMLLSDRPTLIKFKESGEKEWNVTWERYLVAASTEQGSFRACLAKSKDPRILSRYLELAWNTDFVRKQDYFSVLTYISYNPVGIPLVYSYVKSNWAAIVERYTLNDRRLGRLIPTITRSFNTPQQLDDLQAFFKKNPESGAGALQRKQAVSKIKANIVWVQNQAPEIKTWLQNNVLH